MKTTRIIVGIQSALLCALLLRLLWQVRTDYLWSALGKWYRDTSKVADVGLPWVVRALWPCAPVAWWSWITPVAFGIFVAGSLRRKLDLHTLILTTFGTLFFIVVVVSVLLAYVKPVHYMGYPYTEAPIDAPSMIANIVMVALSVGFAVRALVSRSAGPSGSDSTTNQK